MAWRTRIATALAFATVISAPAAAQAAGRGDVAALQVALRAVGTYSGTVDGVAGPGTRAAVSRFQARNGLAADGVGGAATRAALGRRGGPAFGSRTMRRGYRGWDVAALQFRLAWHGFPSGTIDGGFGSHTDAAVRRFQAWAGLGSDGVAGPGTVRALGAADPQVADLARAPGALADRRPVRAARQPLPHRPRLPGLDGHAR